MHDKPTYWEYRFANQDGYVKTKDGRYFKTEVGKAAKWIPFGVATILLVLCFGLFYLGMLHGINLSKSSNRLFDYIMILMLLSFIQNCLQYRLIKYHLIQDDSDDSEIDKNTTFSPKRLRKVVFILALPIWIFMLMNSSFVMLLYSTATVNPTVIEVTVDAADHDAVPVDADTILLQNLPSDTRMNITVSKAVYRAKFYLDGEQCSAFDDISAFSIHFFWEKYYPRNEYTVLLSDIHDGSVLAMDCGDLHREWTFEVESDE